MEDTIVKVGYYAYSLRVDTKEKKLVDNWLQFYKVDYFLYGQEEGKLTGKHHIQGIVWFKEKLEVKEVRKLRQWFLGKTLKTKQPVSFTICRKPESLLKYCQKDEKVTTNLTHEERKRFGEWKSKEQLQKQFRDSLRAYAKIIAFKSQPCIITNKKINNYYEDDLETHTEPSSYDRREFCIKIIEFYRQNKRYPNKRMINSLLFEYQYMNNDEIYNNMFYNN